MAAPPVPVPSRGRVAERADLGLAPVDTVVLTVARLAPQKNLGMLLDIAAGVRDRADLRFVIAGDGPERAALAAGSPPNGWPCNSWVIATTLGSLLAAADLVLLTSTWEARALVAQEALLAGVPLVSTRVGGIAELVGDAAVLVEPGDAAGAARQVRRLADDAGERARLRAAGLRQAATWPDEDEVVEDLLAAYAAVRIRR